MAPSVADLTRGRQILDNLVEYPLPKTPGTRDYIFHFVKDEEGYGKEARSFLGRFYPHHTASDARSLEDLITTLDTDVTQHGVKHIREIIIVTHGNLQLLKVPLLNGISDTTLPEFQFLWSFSLACLQKDILDGKYPGFAAKRARVIAHLDDESWVTIRGCRFGSSRNGLYATFSFFGGRANVYAPTEYQLFARHVLGDGARFETHFDVHRHLVRQHFLPRDVHTPDRREAIVRAMIDPGKFSEPFQIATTPVVDPRPRASDSAYEAIVAGLNARRIHPLLAAKFTEQGFTLTPRRGGIVVRFASEKTTARDDSSRDAAWKIENTVLQHEGDTYDVSYQVLRSYHDRSVRRAGGDVVGRGASRPAAGTRKPAAPAVPVRAGEPQVQRAPLHPRETHRLAGRSPGQQSEVRRGARAAEERPDAQRGVRPGGRVQGHRPYRPAAAAAHLCGVDGGQGAAAADHVVG